MSRTLSLIAALLSPFMFPSAVSLLLAAVAAFYTPFAALAVGILHDLLYLPSGAFPMGVVIGTLGTFLALVVRRFVKTSIIGG